MKVNLKAAYVLNKDDLIVIGGAGGFIGGSLGRKHLDPEWVRRLGQTGSGRS